MVARAWEPIRKSRASAPFSIQRSGATVSKRASSRSKVIALRRRTMDRPERCDCWRMCASSACRKAAAEVYRISAAVLEGLLDELPDTLLALVGGVSQLCGDNQPPLTRLPDCQDHL